MSNAKEINDITFDTEVLKAKGVVLVDFWAPWCGPCRKLGPVLDDIAKEMENDVKVCKVNTDENLKIAREYQISGLPSLVVFKDGEAKEIMVGLMPKSTIVQNIQKHM